MLVETHLRSIIKGISWRVLATLATVLIVYVIFGRLDLAILAGVIESVSKIALYYLHERGWQAVRWGFREKHRPCVIWMTGLSGSGKTTLGQALQKSLESEHVRVQLIDGDLLREGLNADLGFDEASRAENVRRASHLAKLMTDKGFVVICTLISPYAQERAKARRLWDDDAFVEVFVNTPLAVCEARDPKGLYKKARSGEIAQFTGLDAPYEQPDAPELVIDTSQSSIDQSVACVKSYLKSHKLLG